MTSVMVNRPRSPGLSFAQVACAFILTVLALTGPGPGPAGDPGGAAWSSPSDHTTHGPPRLAWATVERDGGGLEDGLDAHSRDTGHTLVDGALAALSHGRDGRHDTAVADGLLEAQAPRAPPLA